MTQENESKEVISDSQIKAEKPIRKGLSKYIRVYRSLAYISGLLAIVFFVIALIELLKIYDSPLISSLAAFHYSLLLAILSLVSRLCSKMFEER